MVELSSERRAFQGTLRDWVDREFPKTLVIELERQEHVYPHALWDEMTKMGLHGLGISEEYGGAGGGPVDSAIAARELARNLGGLTWVWAITAFAGSRAIGSAGSDEQKREFLPQIAEGRLRFAIAATEPGGGTDLLGAMRTRGERVDGGWKINGQKMWSTGAAEADYLLLIAKTSEAREGSRHPGTTAFLVKRDQPGITTSYIPKIGMRAVGSCEVFLDDVFVPDEHVLGEVDRGFRAMTTTLNHERVISAAMALGMIDGVVEEAVDYATQREAFGKVIGGHQIIQHYIANLVIWQKQAELLAFDVAGREEAGLPYEMEAKIAKVATSEHAVAAADLGLQVLGGMGLAQETNMQRYWRDVRQFRIAPISNEMARNSIAESVGMPRSY
ncbi:acyl-CoA dehydrogenase family protein [Georgenia sp. SYP-B2076]|uniref:acyl-CoA dehydrogenase family protein n=1 Tax=Georgenia sp. SYP-B2076 TaxID=2495881 RepID=UPI000F8DE06E|nr:acyl-CoA dehydrogenase family protein [Georgenia sp. SYP-B2076]